jgi:hypothetical protein
MPFDLRRCAEAAAHAALAEAFARHEPIQPPPRRRFRPVRAAMMTAALAAGLSLAVRSDLRRAVSDGLSRRLQLDQLLEDLDLEKELGSHPARQRRRGSAAGGRRSGRAKAPANGRVASR